MYFFHELIGFKKEKKNALQKLRTCLLMCPKKRKNELLTSRRCSCSHSPMRGSSFLHKIASRCSNIVYFGTCEFDEKCLKNNFQFTYYFNAGTYYSKALPKPVPKNHWDLPRGSPIYFKISPRLLLLSHLGRYFFHQPKQRFYSYGVVWGVFVLKSTKKLHRNQHLSLLTKMASIWHWHHILEDPEKKKRRGSK